MSNKNKSKPEQELHAQEPCKEDLTGAEENESELPCTKKNDPTTQPIEPSSQKSNGAALAQTDPNISSTTGTSPPTTSLARHIREFPEDLSPWEKPVSMKTVAEEMAQLIKRHCVLTDEEVDAIVLWLISSYLINSFRIFPKLSLISPEKRCGKTTTMEVIMSMSKDGVLASNLSASAIYRITNQHQVTLLIDEADTFIKGGDPQLVGLINSSHSKDGSTVIRCEGDTHEARAFSTWMAMALASIGDLPPTIMDRSIVVKLRRKKPAECVERIPGNLLEQCRPIRQKILRWCLDTKELVEANPVEPPPIGNDRAADNWLPLFSVAHQIGGNWGFRCESAYRALTQVPDKELPTQLLSDIRDVLNGYPKTSIRSQELVERLWADPDKPWSSPIDGKRLTATQMARWLSPYDIKPQTLRFQGGTGRGYKKDLFLDAFERYLD